MPTRKAPLLLPFLSVLVLLPSLSNARVVINEILYHAPDDLEDLEYVELHNTGDQAVNLGRWKFTKGLKFEFPVGTRIEAGGFLVLCRNRDRFRQFYDAPVAGEFASKLSNNGERLELSDARGRIADAVKYQDKAPWPLGADGLSGSLERICPDAGGDNPVNWASSPLSPDRIKPAGTPGKVNANFSAHPPPLISGVKLSPENPIPNQPMTVEATVGGAAGVRGVNLLFRLAGPGFETPETSLPMSEIFAGRYAAVIPGQAANQLIRFRIQAHGTNGARRFFPPETEPRPALSSYVQAPFEPAKVPFGWMIYTTDAEFKAAEKRSKAPARGGFNAGMFGRSRDDADDADKKAVSSRSAYIYFDPARKGLEVFDFAEIEPRKGGWKVHFAKGQMLREMSTINLIFEHDEKFVLAEPLAYEVYRQAGMAAAQSHHVRIWQDGQPLGYHLLVEQPNRAFLRRNKIADDGNLYKILWYERGVVGQHEKKTNTREGPDDIVELVDALGKAKGDALWELIKKNFDVRQVVNYFAVNTVLSHWDGFFNNYFAYHDRNGTGRWTMYPWDEDQTWGITGMMGTGEVFYNMPLSFGMEGDTPPGGKDGREGGPGFGPFGGGRGAMWWRPGGYFSKPLLANPQFRQLFLARTREILETVYTEDKFLPLIDAMGEQLKPEVKFRAELLKADPDRALQNLDRNLENLREHLKKRRDFLLAQDEIKNAGKFSKADLGLPDSTQVAKPKKRKQEQPKPE